MFFTSSCKFQHLPITMADNILHVLSVIFFVINFIFLPTKEKPNFCLTLINLSHISKQHHFEKFCQWSPCLVTIHWPEDVLTFHYFQWPESSSECLIGDAEFCTVAIPCNRIHLSLFCSLILCAFEIYLLFKFHSSAL